MIAEIKTIFGNLFFEHFFIGKVLFFGKNNFNKKLIRFETFRLPAEFFRALQNNKQDKWLKIGSFPFIFLLDKSR